MKPSNIILAIIAAVGAFALGVVTQVINPAEKVNALWLVIAAACFFIISYRLYGTFICAKVLSLNDKIIPPSKRLTDGRRHPTQVRCGMCRVRLRWRDTADRSPRPVLAAQFG